MGAFALATLAVSATEPAAPKPLLDLEGVPEQLVTEDRRSAFLRRMADKASALGMKTAHFANPSGLTWNSRASANDLLKLGMACAHHPVFSNIWCKVTATVEIKGPHARTVKLRHNYTDLAGWKDFTAKYPFLGGKGGSLGGAKHSVRAHVIVTAIAGKRYVFAISGMKSSKDDPFGMDLEIAAWSAFDGSRSHAGPNADKPHVPASTSKMMTALCALDAAGNSRTPVVVRQSDITRGSGIKCYEGDEFSFEDALTAMILPSSNTLAETMSRH